MSLRSSPISAWYKIRSAQPSCSTTCDGCCSSVTNCGTVHPIGCAGFWAHGSPNRPEGFETRCWEQPTVLSAVAQTCTSSPTVSNSAPILSDLLQGQAGEGNTQPKDDLQSIARANAPSSVPSYSPGHHGGQGWCHGQYLHYCWQGSSGSGMRFVQGTRAGSPAYFNKMELSAMP